MLLFVVLYHCVMGTVITKSSVCVYDVVLYHETAQTRSFVVPRIVQCKFFNFSHMLFFTSSVDNMNTLPGYSTI